MLWLVSWLTRHSLHRIIVTRALAFGKVKAAGPEAIIPLKKGGSGLLGETSQRANHDCFAASVDVPFFASRAATSASLPEPHFEMHCMTLITGRFNRCIRLGLVAMI